MITMWPQPLSYEIVSHWMLDYVKDIKKNIKDEAIWFLEHLPVYTYGARTESDQIDLAKSEGLPLSWSPRGGKMTFHGPGQRIIYIMINLEKRKLSVHHYVFLLEQWIVDCLSSFSIKSFRYPPHTGIWTNQGKIASLGIHISSGVSSHGIALNISGDLSPFHFISPCGLSGKSITSLHEMGVKLSFQEVDFSLCSACPFLSQGSFRILAT